MLFQIKVKETLKNKICKLKITSNQIPLKYNQTK